MSECKECSHEIKHEEAMPNIVINITYNDCRVGKDESTYVDNVKVDSEE